MTSSSLFAGSPPQVRGKLNYYPIRHDEAGITPAGAGKTYRAQRDNRTPQDHPRRCGENATPSVCPNGWTGSPPQVRGKRLYIDYFCKEVRITPAGAGKTIKTRLWKPKKQDHPRRCGENGWMVRQSSRKTRITPAGAGKTSSIFVALSFAPDHPRRCGENKIVTMDGVTHDGITPAGAGKTNIFC